MSSATKNSTFLGLLAIAICTKAKATKDLKPMQAITSDFIFQNETKFRTSYFPASNLSNRVERVFALLIFTSNTLFVEHRDINNDKNEQKIQMI